MFVETGFFVGHLGTHKWDVQHGGQRTCLQGMLRREEWVKLFPSKGDGSWGEGGTPEGAQHSQPQIIAQSCLAVLLRNKAQASCFLLIFSLCISKQPKSWNNVWKKMHTEFVLRFWTNFASSRTIPSPSIRFELVKGAVCYLALETFCAWVGEAGFEFSGEDGAPCSVPFPSGLTCANEPGSFGSSTTASSSPGPLQPGGDPRAAGGRSPRSLRAAEGRWPLPPGSASPPGLLGPGTCQALPLGRGEAGHDSARCTRSSWSQLYPGVYQRQRGQQSRKIILLPYSNPMWPHVEYCTQLRVPSVRRTWGASLEEGHKDAQRVEHLCCADTLGELCVLSLERRRLQGCLIAPSST